LRTWRIVVLALAALLAGGGLAFSGGSLAAAARGHVFDRADLDTTCQPCQNFFQFATGGWAKRNPIRPEYASWGRFDELRVKNQEILHGILEAAAHARNAPGSNEQKIGDFYASCMDSKKIEAGGITPIQPELARIANIQGLAQLEEEVARLQTQGVGALFFFGAEQDDKDSTRMIGEADQGGLGLPSRDYYLDQDDHSRQIRDQYQQHVSRMFELAGDAPDAAASHASAVLAIETRMAQASKTPVELRDPEGNYHKMIPAELRALTPEFSWENIFRTSDFRTLGK
jgi:putative endopeptidase